MFCKDVFLKVAFVSKANMTDRTRENRFLATFPLDVIVKARPELVAASTLLAIELSRGKRFRCNLAILG